MVIHYLWEKNNLSGEGPIKYTNTLVTEINTKDPLGIV